MKVPRERMALRNNGHMAPVTLSALSADASSGRPWRRPRRLRDRVYEWLALGLYLVGLLTACLISLMAVAGFCLLMFFGAVAVAGTLRHLFGIGGP